MRFWLKRWLVYLLLPAGLVLLFVPLSTHRKGEAEREFLFLEIIETLACPDELAEAAPSPSEPESAEDAWRRINEQRKRSAQEEACAAAVINPYGYRRIQPEDLAAYPAVAEEVATLRLLSSSMRAQRLRSTRPDAVPLEEWTAFVETAGISAGGGAFQYGKHILKGQVEAVSVDIGVEVENLKTGSKIVGGLFLVLGLFLLKGCYAPASGGIRVGKRSAILIWDVVIIGVGMTFSLWFLDLILAQVFQTVPDWKEDITWGMGVFWVVLANPVLALITTATSLQTLWITSHTIVLKGLFGSSTMAWPDVDGICVSQLYSPRKVFGRWASHRVMKVLKISAGGSTLCVLEPPYASTKKMILEKLAEQAPEVWKERIAAVSKEWLLSW